MNSTNSYERLYHDGYRDGQKAEREKCKALLTKIAETEGVLECTSHANWREKVKQMAVNFLKGK